MSRIYATPDDLTGQIPGLSDAELEELISKASLIVDDVLDNSEYAVDDEGMPTDEDVKSALRRAVCAQAVHLNDVGGFAAFTSAGRGPSQLGSLRFDSDPSADSAGGSLASMVSPETVLILKVEGLLSSKVRVLR